MAGEDISPEQRAKLRDLLRESRATFEAIEAGDHPSTWTLANYHSNELDEDTAGHVQVHLLHCHQCARELQILEQGEAALIWGRVEEAERGISEWGPRLVVGWAKVVGSAVEQASERTRGEIRNIAEVICPPAFGLLVPAIAPARFRGAPTAAYADETVTVRGEVADLVLEIKVNPTFDNKNDVTVRITRNNVPFSDGEVEFGAASRALDGEGVVHFAARKMGEYTLRVLSASGETLAETQVELERLSASECVATGRDYLDETHYSRAIDFLSAASEMDPADVNTKELLALACTAAYLDPETYASDLSTRPIFRETKIEGPELSLETEVRGIQEALTSNNVDSWLVLFISGALDAKRGDEGEAVRKLGRALEEAPHKIITFMTVLSPLRSVLERTLASTIGEAQQKIEGLQEQLARFEEKMEGVTKDVQSAISSIRPDPRTLDESDPRWEQKCAEFLDRMEDLVKEKFGFVPGSVNAEAEQSIRQSIGRRTWKALTDKSREFLIWGEFYNICLDKFYSGENPETTPICGQLFKALEVELETHLIKWKSGGGLDEAIRQDMRAPKDASRLWQRLEEDLNRQVKGYALGFTARCLHAINQVRDRPTYKQSRVMQVLSRFEEWDLVRLAKPIEYVAKIRNGGFHTEFLGVGDLRACRTMIIGYPEGGLLASFLRAVKPS